MSAEAIPCGLAEGTVADRAIAITRQKIPGHSWRGIARFYKVCLSFVMPQQHSKSPEFEEDAV
jgi:hypothetical protein